MRCKALSTKKARTEPLERYFEYESAFGTTLRLLLVLGSLLYVSTVVASYVAVYGLSSKFLGMATAYLLLLALGILAAFMLPAVKAVKEALGTKRKKAKSPTRYTAKHYLGVYLLLTVSIIYVILCIYT